MELRVRDVAAYLDETEETIIRWAKRGTLPAHHVQDQYMFNRVELQEWAALNSHQVSPELFASSGNRDEQPALSAAITRGGVYHQIPGATREQVLEAVTALPGIPADVNRLLLLQLLVGRETLASTALGNGIAIPHPRNPLVVRIHEPAVLLGFLEEPVDFHALDGQPVRVLFTLLSPSVRAHLQMLGKIAVALHDEAFQLLLKTMARKEELLARLHELEALSAHGAGTRPLGQREK